MTGNTPHPVPRSPGRERRGGHGLMMIACCIPMLIIAIVLVATGVVGVGFIVVAVVCTGMMALMMGGMNHGAAEPGAMNHQPNHRHILHSDDGPGVPPANTGPSPPQAPRANNER